MSDPPNKSPDNAETVADDGPRWINFSASFAGDPQFLGRVGPIDIWLDAGDTALPFLVGTNADHSWRKNAARIIDRCKQIGAHLTLHDECIIYALCETHNKEET